MAVKGIRSKNLYEPSSKEPFALSRSKLELFLECARCFYLDRRLGVGRPSSFPLTLNIAVDALLKKEFDIHRANGEPHPLMKTYGIRAIPYAHPDLALWRENFKGIRYVHPSTNLTIHGAPDDIWIDEDGKLMVVDYKATSTAQEITLDDEWKQRYKRQIEIYQWLLRMNGFSVSDTGYFVFVNAAKNRGAFDGKLEFSVQILPYAGSDSWIDDAVIEAHLCLCRDHLPPSADECEWCQYCDAVGKVTADIRLA